MIRWPRFSDIFALRPPSETRLRWALDGLNPDGPSSSSAKPGADPQWHKIRFDNTIRLWISIPAYLACIPLRLTGVLSSIIPMTVIFSSFGVLQFLGTWLFSSYKHPRRFDFFLCATDLIATSAAVFVTGGTASPLYFIYFIPLIVHAFHRDWSLVLFNGFGGVALYAVAIAHSIPKLTPAVMTDLGARVFMMLVTVSIACLSLTLLRRKDDEDQIRIGRLNTLSLIGQLLNNVCALNDLPATVTDLVKLVNAGLGAHLKPWSRALLIQGDPSVMRAIADPADDRPEFKQELTPDSCPAVHSNSPFVMPDQDKGECPTEHFPFGSHLCIPVSGTENENFGVLFAGSAQKNAFKTDERQFLDFVAKSLGLSIQRLQRMEELRRGVEMNSCVMATYIASTRSLEATYSSILEGILTILKVDQASLMLWDASKGVLRTKEVKGPKASEEWDLEFQMGEGIPGRVLDTGRPYWTNDIFEDAMYKARKSSIKSFLSLPLRSIRGEKIGVVNAARLEQRSDFSVGEIDLASTFATRAALSIENAMLHLREQNTIPFNPPGNPPGDRKAA
jgi:GAF domain-containing protein